MLTDDQIEHAKASANVIGDPFHEHNDCIRIAYEWIDAQPKLSRATGWPGAHMQTKHYIERWAGRYVSQADVEVAAWMHPDVIGSYPGFNISTKLTCPDDGRLAGIGEAMTQPDYRARHNAPGEYDSPYTRMESING